MVTTRSQHRQAHDDDDDINDNKTAHLQADKHHCTQRRDSALRTPTNGAQGAERLGRGCRVHRQLVTLDEEYLRQSHQEGARTRGAGGRGCGPLADGEPEFVIHQRYPPRQAAQRALLSLKETLGDLQEDDDSNSQAEVFHFRHNKEHESGRSQWKGVRGRGSNSSSTTASSWETSDASSASSGTSSPSAKRSPHRGDRKHGETVRPAHQRKRERESSLSLSITNESMRATSVEELADRDAKAQSTCSSDSEVFVTDKDMRQAMRNAKESTEKNISINHYMASALGQEDARKARLKKIDRRYRHLFMQDEADKAAASAGGTGGTGTGGGVSGSSGALGDISPLHVDGSITFDSVGGLPGHIVTLREMVLLPLMYPDVLKHMHIASPRGVLFVGPPGTGKTLIARALANEGSCGSQRKITFFMRKGADILSKWVGESERQLNLLFEEAKRLQPSIIFFDELDGLAPTRHTKTEQTQAALVATFLALLDGLDDRGQVVVIGATNRPDTIDPALRRPGRFDRELFFPLPDAAARRHILSILTKDMLPLESYPQRAETLTELVEHTEGYSGADLKALCMEAGLNRLRSALPQLYTDSRRLVVNPALHMLSIRHEDLFIAARRVRPSLQRGGPESHGVHLDEHVECLFRGVRDKVLLDVARWWPAAERALQKEKRDCSDLQSALRDLCSFAIPCPQRPALVFLEIEESVSAIEAGGAARQMVVLNTAFAMMRGLPTFHTFNVHLPHLHVDFDLMAALPSDGVESGIGSSAGTLSADMFKAGHMYQLVLAVHRSSPCVVLLRGVEEWLQDQGLPPEVECRNNGRPASVSFSTDEMSLRTKRMKAFHYYMNLLVGTGVVIIVPCVEPSTCQALLSCQTAPAVPSEGEATTLPRAAAFTTGSLHPLFCVLRVTLPIVPGAHDLRNFVRQMYRTVAIVLRPPASQGTPGKQTEPLREATTAAVSVVQEKNPAARQAQLQLWRKVEYRRLQLRHVLLKWVGQYVISGKYRPLLSADLDLPPGTQLYKDWQRHTRGCRIGLQDILEKVENEDYVCLSQYHDDVDQLVRNVRSFFRSRAAGDQKYRLKALELKETTVLSLYKINRAVARFCEEHRDVVEPPLSDSDDDDAGAIDKKDCTSLLCEDDDPATTALNKKKALQFTSRPKPIQPRRKLRIFGQHRRRRRLSSPAHKVDSHSSEDVASNAIAAEENEEPPMVQHLRDGDTNRKGSGDVGCPQLNPTVSLQRSDRSYPLAFLDTPPRYSSPTHREGPVEDWAVSLLKPLNFYQLHCVYDAVMRELDMVAGRQGREGRDSAGGSVPHSTSSSVHGLPGHTPLEDTAMRTDTGEGVVQFFSRVLEDSVKRHVTTPC